MRWVRCRWRAITAPAARPARLHPAASRARRGSGTPAVASGFRVGLVGFAQCVLLNQRPTRCRHWLFLNHTAHLVRCEAVCAPPVERLIWRLRGPGGASAHFERRAPTVTRAAALDACPPSSSHLVFTEVQQQPISHLFQAQPRCLLAGAPGTTSAPSALLLAHQLHEPAYGFIHLTGFTFAERLYGDLLQA